MHRRVRAIPASRRSMCWGNLRASPRQHVRRATRVGVIVTLREQIEACCLDLFSVQTTTSVRIHVDIKEHRVVELLWV